MRRKSYTASGWGALIPFVLWLALTIWMIYLFIKIAAHVGAWPFG